MASNKTKFNDDVNEARGNACHCLVMRQASRRLVRLYDQALKRHHLTVGQFSLLCMMAGPKDISVQQMADTVDMNQSALSKGLSPLEKQGLLTSHMNPDDARERILTLTPLGVRRLNDAAVSWQQAQQEVNRQNESLDFESLMSSVARINAELA